MKLISLIKKEFHRFFHDPRLIITMLIPGILIYVIYSLLGNIVWKEEPKDYRYTVYVCGESEIMTVFDDYVRNGKITFKQTEDVVAAKAAVQNGEATALIVLPENFDALVEDYQAGADPFTEAPEVQIYYRSADEESSSFYMIASGALGIYQNRFLINNGLQYDLSEADEMQKSIMSGLLPFLVVIFIFSACMSITLESVAGEKERGTLATILVTSVKRSHVALGKVIPLSGIAAIGAASSFLGVSLSMPKLMGVSVGSVFSSLGFTGFLLLFLLIISVVPLIVSLISVISTYAKSVKEASAYTAVVMILVMVISLVSTFVSEMGAWIVAIPVLNAVVCMQGILTMSLSVWQSLVSVALNLAYTALLVFAISKMLSSEKIMFGS